MTQFITALLVLNLALGNAYAVRPSNEGGRRFIEPGRNPKFSIPNASRGRDALSRHQKNLGKIAKRYGKSAQEIEHIIQNDLSHWITDEGYILIADEAEPYSPTADIQNPTVPQIPDADTFKLHSKPDSKLTLYLDFDGEVVNNQYWSASQIDAKSLDTDSNPASFSTSELQIIKSIWAQVAEDYAPFDVDVTTELTSLNRLTRSGTNDQEYGLRVIITSTSSWYGSAGGVAYLNSFTWGNDTPAWVFSSLLGNNAKNVAEATSHEAGHGFGLNHWGQYSADGTAITSSYYAGNGTGVTSWAPIMGNSYSRTVSTWSKGEYPLSGVTLNKTTQDDLAIISRTAPYLSDDYGSSINQPTTLSGTISGFNTVVRQMGFIERNTDRDVFMIPAGSGAWNLTVSPVSIRPNLDFRAVLRASNGSIVGDQDPVGISSVNFNFSNLPQDQYTLEIYGVGYGDPATVGYSNYASLGRYFISGSYPSSGSTPPTTPSPTPQPTATPKPTATPTPTATPKPTATPTPVPTATPKPTATPVPTSTPTPAPTATPKPTATPVPTSTPTPVPTATPQPTATPVPTITPMPTVTPVPTITPTPTPDVCTRTNWNELQCNGVKKRVRNVKVR